MANSLLLNGLECCAGNGSPYAIVTGPPDFGTVTPDTTTISSLLLDGDIVTGDRTGNKTWTFSVYVFGANRQDVSAKVDALLFAVSAITFPVIWTPDGGASANFTAYRATAQVAKGMLQLQNLVATVNLTFQTGPFGQSSQSVSVTVPAAGAPSQLQIDGMNSGVFTNGTRDTTHEYEGASCMAVTMTRTGAGSLFAYHMASAAGRSITSVDLSSYVGSSFRLRWDQAPANYEVGGSLTLTDSHGASESSNLLINTTKGSTKYQLVSFDVSSFSAIDLTTVTAWKITLVTNSVSFSSTPAATTTAYIDDLRVYPAASAGNATGEGQVLTIPAVVGSARTPVSLEFDIGGATITDLVVHHPPDDQDPDLTILAGVALSGGSYQVTIPPANANYNDTYTVVALLSSSPSGSKTLTAEFTQKIGSTIIGGPTDVVLETTSGAFLLVLGEITLPLSPTPPENQSDSLLIALSSTGADVFTDVLLLSLRGQTDILQGISAEAVWFDAPGTSQLVGMGPVYAAATIDRTQAFGVMPELIAYSGGPMIFDPGDNRLLAASAQGAPNTTATYFARYLDEALT